MTDTQQAAIDAVDKLLLDTQPKLFDEIAALKAANTYLNAQLRTTKRALAEAQDTVRQLKEDFWRKK